MLNPDVEKGKEVIVEFVPKPICNYCICEEIFNGISFLKGEVGPTDRDICHSKRADVFLCEIGNLRLTKHVKCGECGVNLLKK